MSKREPRSWIVCIKVTEEGEAVVEAETADEAREFAELSMYDDFTPTELIDIEVIGNPKENV